MERSPSLPMGTALEEVKGRELDGHGGGVGWVVDGVRRPGHGKVRRVFRIHELAHWNL